MPRLPSLQRFHELYVQIGSAYLVEADARAPVISNFDFDESFWGVGDFN